HSGRLGSVVDPGAARDRRAGESAHISHRMELAVLLVDCRALLRDEADADTFLLQPVRALANLRPFLVVAGDLSRAVPREVAGDSFLLDDRADELLVVPGEPPDAQHPVFAVTACRGNEIFGHAREKKARVSPARRFGDR